MHCACTDFRAGIDTLRDKVIYAWCASIWENKYPKYYCHQDKFAGRVVIAVYIGLRERDQTAMQPAVANKLSSD